MADILAIRAGERERLRGLVERHGPRVHDLARRLLKDAHLAEDVTQRAFLNAWKALDRFDLARPFRHWILRIATNLCHNVHAARALRPERRLPEGPADGPIEFPDEATPASVDPEARARAAHVREAIERLPERYRVPIVLHHVHGMPLSEVAELLGLPVATLKTHLFRGREALGGLLFLPGDPGETRAKPGGTAERPRPPAPPSHP